MGFRAPPILLAALMLCGLLASMPVAATTVCDTYGNGTEDFEDYSLFAVVPDTCLTTSSSVSYGTPAIDPTDGSNQVYSTGNNVNAGLALDVSPCQAANADIPVSVEFRFRFTALPPAGNKALYGFGATGLAAALSISSTGATGLYTKSSAGSQLDNPLTGSPVVVVNTWYRANITVHDIGALDTCSTSGLATVVLLTEAGVPLGGFTQALTGSGGAAASIGHLSMFEVTVATQVNSGSIGILDDIQLSNFPVQDENAWCPNLLSEDYGYTYLNNVDFDATIPDVGDTLETNSGFVYTGDDPLDSVAAKGADTEGSLAMHANITIEANDEGTDSVYRVSFSTISNLPSGSTVGNGFSTGNFADSLQANWEENGGDWQITIFAVVGGVRTQLGGAINIGNPDRAQPYTFWVDTRPDARMGFEFGSLTGSSADISSPGPYVMVSAPESSIANSGSRENTIVAYRKLATYDITAFDEDEFWNVWFTGESTNVLGSTTIIDNNEAGSHDSSCFFDDIGTFTAEGDQGTEPIGSIVDSGSDDDSSCVAVLCIDSADVPAGFTAATFNGMMGMLLVGMVAVGGVGALQSQTSFRVGGGALVLFAGIGYMIGLYMGLLPLWPIVALVVGGAAYVFLRMRSGG